MSIVRKRRSDYATGPARAPIGQPISRRPTAAIPRYLGTVSLKLCALK